MECRDRVPAGMSQWQVSLCSSSNSRVLIESVHLMIHYQVMIRLNIHEAKTHLSKYLARLKEGDTIVLCKRNVPVAEIRPLSKPVKGKRQIGLFKGQIRIPKSFFEPLADDVLDEFEGKYGR